MVRQFNTGRPDFNLTSPVESWARFLDFFVERDCKLGGQGRDRIGRGFGWLILDVKDGVIAAEFGRESSR